MRRIKQRLDALARVNAGGPAAYKVQRLIIIGDGEPEPFPPAVGPVIRITRRITETPPVEADDGDRFIGNPAGVWNGAGWRPKK